MYLVFVAKLSNIYTLINPVHSSAELECGGSVQCLPPTFLVKGGTGCINHPSSKDGLMDHQLYSVDGHGVPLVRTACGSLLGLAAQPC